MNITILGAGSFGTAMGAHLATLGHSVLLWTIDAKQSLTINETSFNPFCFSDIKLDKKVVSTTNLKEALAFSDYIIMAIPSQFVREVLTEITEIISVKNIHILNLSKGIEISTGMLMNMVYREVSSDFIYSSLSGPSHAEEVINSCPTTVAIASHLPGEAKRWQEIITGNNFRVYTSDDVTGIEVGGATKNIYAIAAGIAHAMNLGDNAAAALACRGLAEIGRFGTILGAKPSTLAGLAGVGDLMVTCFSVHSRNFRLGLEIGKGKSLKEAIETLGQVAEGVYTVKAIVKNSRKFNVEMPLADGVYRVLFNEEKPKDILDEFFARPLKPEFI